LLFRGEGTGEELGICVGGGGGGGGGSVAQSLPRERNLLQVGGFGMIGRADIEGSKSASLSYLV